MKALYPKVLSVTMAPQKTALNVKREGDERIMKSESVHVNLNLKNSKISYSTLAGEPLLVR